MHLRFAKVRREQLLKRRMIVGLEYGGLTEGWYEESGRASAGQESHASVEPEIAEEVFV